MKGVASPDCIHCGRHMGHEYELDRGHFCSPECFQCPGTRCLHVNLLIADLRAALDAANKAIAQTEPVPVPPNTPARIWVDGRIAYQDVDRSYTYSRHAHGSPHELVEYVLARPIVPSPPPAATAITLCGFPGAMGMCKHHEPCPVHAPRPPAATERGETKRCAHCGKPATCYGAYEGQAAGYACDVCCGHGNEDGSCDRVDDDRKEPQR